MAVELGKEGEEPSSVPWLVGVASVLAPSFTFLTKLSSLAQVI